MGRRGCLQLLNAQSVHSYSWPLELVTGAASSCHLCNSVITPRVSVSKSANYRRVLQCPRNEEKHNGLALCLWGMPPCGLAQGSLICDMGWGTLVAPVLRRCPARAVAFMFLLSCGVLRPAPDLENIRK